MYLNNLLLAFQNVQMMSDFSFSSIYTHICFLDLTSFALISPGLSRACVCLTLPTHIHTHTHSQLLSAGRDHSVFTCCCCLAKWDQLGVKCILMCADRGRLSKNIIPRSPFKKHVRLLISSCCTINVFQKITRGFWVTAQYFVQDQKKLTISWMSSCWIDLIALPHTLAELFSIPSYKSHQTPEYRIWWAEGWWWSPVLQE